MEISLTQLVGYIAAFCTTGAFIPQVIQTLKTRDTRAISLGMYALFVTGIAMWLAYGILLRDVPIIAANAVTLALSGVVLAMKIKYK